MLLTLSALGLGFLHGLGADHLMAIAALSVPADANAARTHPMRVAFGFAIGHALLLACGSALVILLGWQIPVLVERAGEMLGGALLVLLGAFSLWIAFSHTLYGHTHPHGDPLHTHWHLHLGRQAAHHARDAHSHIPGILGAVFAISGLRALTMLAPFERVGNDVTASMLRLLFLIVAFAAGILISMSLFGIVLSRVLGSALVARTIGRGAAILTAAASIGLGLYWMVS